MSFILFAICKPVLNFQETMHFFPDSQFFVYKSNADWLQFSIARGYFTDHNGVDSCIFDYLNNLGL